MNTKLFAEFIKLGQDALSMHHYELAEKTSVHDPVIWKAFLTDPEAREYIDSELQLINSSELNKLLKDISSSHSVGQAQIIGALSKVTENNNKQKAGTAFIYTYVPLNPEQKFAENVKILEEDPFLK